MSRVERYVDKTFYLETYPDVAESGINPVEHYVENGWREGRNPSAEFNTVWYLCQYKDQIGSLQNPLEHYALSSGKRNGFLTSPPSDDRSWLFDAINDPSLPYPLLCFCKDYAAIFKSGLFDGLFYAQRYHIKHDPVEHFIRFGWRQGNDPSSLFSTTDYLNLYHDVRIADINPLVHYIDFGRAEGRRLSRNQRTNSFSPVCPPLDRRLLELKSDIQRRLQPPSHKCTLTRGPKISVLTPVYNVSIVWIEELVQSILQQTYENWQLCIVDDSSSDTKLREYLAGLPEIDSRILVTFRHVNGGISAATNDCLSMAQGAFIALVDNDDLLTHDAFEKMATAIINNSPDWLYSDECKISADGSISDLFAKPDWSPYMLLNYMYTGHLSLYRTELVRQVGGFRSEFDFSQDYDLALRLSENSDLRICHVAEYLYCWRAIETSAAAGGKPKARISNISALTSAITRRGWRGQAIPLATANRVYRPEADAMVSIIIPSDNINNILASCKSITENTTYLDYEVIVVTNSKLVAHINSTEYGRKIKCVNFDKKFNFSAKCNVGADASSGSYLFFFNDDVRIITKDWIQSILEVLTLPNVGAVGPKLLYENDTIQHAGMITGVRRGVGTAFHTYPQNSSAHFNFAQCVREVSLVCGALLAVPKKVFGEVGGFDSTNTPINHSDVDLCFRIRDLNYTCVYTPYATLYHIGHASLGTKEALAEATRDGAELYLIKRWANYVAYDPYFTPKMKELLYIDSPEEFSIYPGHTKSEAKRSILILSNDLSGSGAPKVVFDLARTLDEKNYFITVISPVDGKFREQLQLAGITVIIDELYLYGHESSMSLLKDFDIVIANTIVTWRAFAKLAKTIDTYVYVHETALVEHLNEADPEFRLAFNSVKGVWCGSSLSQRALARVGIAASILEYGVDDAALNAPEAPVLISVFGSFEPRKGQDLAVLAVNELAADIRKGVRLRLYGRTLDSTFKSAVEKLAANVHETQIYGEISYEDYRLTLANSDIVLVCSRDDTLPLVSLDALAFGKTLVVSSTTGTSAYIRHMESGFILYENSPSEISSALALLISDTSLRRSLGNKGRAVFEKTFTRSAFEKRLLEHIEG